MVLAALAAQVTKCSVSLLPMQFAQLVKKYNPHFYVNGHDHVVCYFNARQYGYSTQFFTSGQRLEYMMCLPCDDCILEE